MSRAGRAVCMHLIYRSHGDSELWRAVVDTTIDWDASARPELLDRYTGPRAGDESPWSDAYRAELVTLLAGDAPFSWNLSAGEETGLTFSRSAKESRCSLTVDGNRTSIADRYCALVESLPPDVSLGFGYHVGTDDEECEMDGLSRLTRVPAVLHVGADELARAPADVAASPCEVRDLGARGLVLVAGKDADAVAAHLGISGDTPWRLI